MLLQVIRRARVEEASSGSLTSQLLLSHRLNCSHILGHEMGALWPGHHSDGFSHIQQAVFRWLFNEGFYPIMSRSLAFFLAHIEQSSSNHDTWQCSRFFLALLVVPVWKVQCGGGAYKSLYLTTLNFGLLFLSTAIPPTSAADRRTALIILILAPFYRDAAR